MNSLQNLPNISLVICVYNRALELGNLLNSLLRLMYSGNLEVVVVDDCSTENIFEIVECYKNRMDRFSVIYTRMDENSGPAIARNTGVSISNGEYIWFLDSDTEIIHPTMIDDILTYFEEFPRVGIIGGEMQPFGQDLYYFSYGHYPNLAKWNDFTLVSEEEKVPLFIKKDILATSNLFLRHSLFDKIGGFRKDYICLEDADFCLRILKLGYYHLVSSKTLVIHYHSRAGRTKGKFSFYDDPYQLALAYHENRIRLLCDHYPFRVKFLPFLDAFFIPLAVFRSSRSKNSTLHVSEKVGKRISLLFYLKSQLYGLLYNYFVHCGEILFRSKISTKTYRRDL